MTRQTPLAVAVLCLLTVGDPSARGDVPAIAPASVARKADVPYGKAVAWWRVPILSKKLIKQLPLVEVLRDLRDLAEDLATREKAPTVATFLGMAQAGAKLEVLTSSGEILLKGEDESFLGNNRIRLRVPCKFRYVVDLQGLGAANLRFDRARRLLTVCMPAVSLDDPVPDREATEMLERVNPTLRSAASLQRLHDHLLAEQLKPLAREKGEEGLTGATAAGKAILQQFLQKVYAPVMPGLKVIVE